MQSVVEEKAILGLNLNSFVAINSLLLTKYFLYNHGDSTCTIVTNSKYKVQHNTVCAISLHGRKVFDSALCPDLNVKKVCIKIRILNNHENFNSSGCFKDSS